MRETTQYQKAYKLLNKIGDHDSFNSKNLYELYCDAYGDINEKSISWILYKLVLDNKIVRIGRNKYMKSQKNSLRKFDYDYSREAKELVDKIIFDYEEVQVQIWELKVLNEFLNHQIATNVIFVEVEKGFEEFIFESIKEEKETNVLIKPDIKTFNQIMSNNIIVVLNLISETINNKEDNKKIIIEKLIVDLFANKYLMEIISKSEYQNIIDSIRSRYVIDYATLNRYAKRRNKETIVNYYIDNNNGGSYDTKKQLY